jgi:hypothetical protein
VEVFLAHAAGQPPVLSFAALKTLLTEEYNVEADDCDIFFRAFASAPAVGVTFMFVASYRDSAPPAPTTHSFFCCRHPPGARIVAF